MRGQGIKGFALKANMKKIYFIRKDRIVELLESLGREFVCIAPAKDDTGSSFYKEWNGGEVNLSYNTDISLKELLNPEVQKILSFEKLDGAVKLAPHSELSFSQAAVFGLRPCDTAALLHICRFAETAPQDTELLEKREALAIITVACGETCPGGLCTATGTGPVASGGFDLQLIPFKGGFIVEGAEGAPVSKHLDNFKEIEVDIEEIKNEIISRVRGEQPCYDMDRAAEGARKGLYPERLMSEFARRCQKCSGCVFICPTCTCFNIMDRVYGDKGERLKVWDSCFLDGFTATAGGGNSVKGADGHLDRRLKCKFSNGKKECATAGFGPSCVGCGRCDRVCPGGIGMSGMLELL